jgi:hypothetical protein
VRRVTAQRGSAPNARRGGRAKRKPWPSSHPIARSRWAVRRLDALGHRRQPEARAGSRPADDRSVRCSPTPR